MSRKLSGLLLLCLLFALPGCAPGTHSQSAPAESPRNETPVMAEIDEWPENEYTQNLFPPESGVPDYTLSDGQAGLFSVFYRDVTREQGRQYIDALCADGFAVLEQDANAVSIGQMLEKDGVFLSVSLSDGVLGVCISLPQDSQS